jgi:hypothetical protein
MIIENLDSFKTINQQSAHESMSSRYAFIPTLKPLNVFQDLGWYPAKIQEKRVLKQQKAGFQTHIVRLGNQDVSVGDEFPEIILVNSHSGGSSFQIKLGYYRLVCSNGLTVGSSVVDHRIRHVGYTDDKVFNAIDDIVNHIPKIDNVVKQWKAIELNRDEKGIFSNSALKLRYDDEELSAVVPYSSLTSPRRWDDRKDDLWTTFNAVQENLIRGGLRGRSREGKNRSMRAVNNITESIKLNSALWDLTEKMAELKLSSN